MFLLAKKLVQISRKCPSCVELLRARVNSLGKSTLTYAGLLNGQPNPIRPQHQHCSLNTRHMSCRCWQGGLYPDATARVLAVSRHQVSASWHGDRTVCVCGGGGGREGKTCPGRGIEPEQASTTKSWKPDMDF